MTLSVAYAGSRTSRRHELKLRAGSPQSRCSSHLAARDSRGLTPVAIRRIRRAMREVRTLYVAAGEDRVRLDRWFKRRWPHLNHVQIQKLVRSGQIRVDGARVKADTRLAAGAQVRVPPLPVAPTESERQRARNAISPRAAAFARRLVLSSDEAVLVLNERAGLAVQGGAKAT